VHGATVTAEQGKVIRRTTTGADGRFVMHLPAGGYDLVARNVGAFGSQAQAQVVVRDGATTTVTLTVDSGIR
jgi:hypothetical protein